MRLKNSIGHYENNDVKNVANLFISIQTDLPSIPSFQPLTDKSPTPSRCSSLSYYVPASHWLAGFTWYYIQQVNRTNYKYNITSYDEDKLWYHEYHPSQQYKWHTDASNHTQYANTQTDSSTTPSPNNHLIPLTEHDRKLSFSLQLSDPNTYQGGDLQFLRPPALNQPAKLITAPKTKGTIIIFPPSLQHRVTPVSKGIRKSIVGWAIGPRWQ